MVDDISRSQKEFSTYLPQQLNYYIDSFRPVDTERLLITLEYLTEFEEPVRVWSVFLSVLKSLVTFLVLFEEKVHT